MVRFVFILLIVILVGNFEINAQERPKVLALVSASPAVVLVGQPSRVTVKVLTPTWFTSAPQLQNFQIENGFVVPVPNQSISEEINGKKYAGVAFNYMVFPFKSGDIIFPSLKIDVESPAEGDYKGIALSIQSPEKRIKSNSIPDEYKGDAWLVATSFFVSENWNKPLDKVKVGDALERTITIQAGGTLAEFLSEVNWSETDGISIYSQTPEQTTDRSFRSSTVSAKQVQKAAYLFEKEGEITIPEMEFSWWNPYRKQLYKKTLPAKTIKVMANPDLGMLDSMKDSLAALQAAEAQEAVVEEEKPFLILGLKPWQFAVAVAVAILVLSILYKIIKKTFHIIKQRNQKFRNSEAYYFRQFSKAVSHHQPRETKQKVMAWLDRFLPKTLSPTMETLIKNAQVENLEETSISLDEKLYGNGKSSGKWDEKTFFKEVKKARKTFKVSQRKSPEKFSDLNP